MRMHWRFRIDENLQFLNQNKYWEITAISTFTTMELFGHVKLAHADVCGEPLHAMTYCLDQPGPTYILKYQPFLLHLSDVLTL